MPYANLNLEGRLVNDPEFKLGKENREFCIFRVAVNQWRGGEEQASFFNCVCGEAISGRIRKAGLQKGRLIHINGELNLRDYQTKDGLTKTSADVTVNNWHYVGQKPKDDAPSGSAPAAASGHPAGTVHEEQYIGDDDDLPL